MFACLHPSTPKGTVAFLTVNINFFKICISATFMKWERAGTKRGQHVNNSNACINKNENISRKK
jgi:hypothetical protein